jgi:predicted dehydrogenase
MRTFPWIDRQVETSRERDSDRFAMKPPVPVVLSGCGAVTEAYYGPALQRLQHRGHIRVAGLHDVSPERLAVMRAHFPDAQMASRWMELLDGAPGLAIVASPPSAHVEQSIAALDAGMSVLCEKPVARNGAEAELVVDAARVAKGVFAVNMIRRHLPACRNIRTLLLNGVLGPVRRVDVFEGGRFDWPVRDAGYFSSEVSGGGVLADYGVHDLDLLTWWFGLPVLDSARDDAMGGVEANSLLELRSGDTHMRLRLSRDWPRPNRFRIEGDRGRLDWNTRDSLHVDLTLRGEAPMTIGVSDIAGKAGKDIIELFAAQLEMVLDATRHRESDNAAFVSATDAAATLALVEQAYAQRSSMSMPWLGAVAVTNGK